MNLTKRNLTYLVASAVATFMLMFSVVTLGGTPAQATVDTNTNETTFWENEYKDEFPGIKCFKHDEDKLTNAHGYTTHVDPGDANNAVVLNPFNPDWDYDKYVLLIVKAGATGTSVVDENNVYVNPVAGTAYAAPAGIVNGQIKAVSHWIVCKGFNPVVTTLPTTPTTVTPTTPTTVTPTTVTPTTETPTTETTVPETTIPETTTVPDSVDVGTPLVVQRQFTAVSPSFTG